MSTPARPEAANRALLIVAFCCLAATGEGFDLQTPGVTLPVLAPLFGLTTGEGGTFLDGFLSQKSLFLSMSTFGLMLGALIGGRLSDRLGRKWVAVGSVGLFGLLSALTAHATDANMLLWCRFLTGLGLGGAMPNLIAIVAETVSHQRRGFAVGALYASMPMGGALAGLSSFVLANPDQWPMIYYIGGAVPLLATVGLIFGVPNTPPQRSADGAVRTGLGHALFGDGRAPRTLVLWLGFFFAMIALYILLSWLPSLLVGKGLPRPQASIVQVGFNLCGALGSVLTGLLIDRRGRSITIALIFLAAIISLGVLASAPAALLTSFLVGCLVGCTVCGTQTTFYALAPSCYPTEVRGTGVGCAVAMGRFGSAVGPMLAGGMLGGGASASRVLMALVPIMILSGLAAVFVSAKTGRAPAGAVAAH